MIPNTKRQAAIKSVDDLYSWSQNFGSVLNPFCLYLVLINYEDYQVTYADLGRYLPTLGYKEQALVGESLVAYSDYPTEIERHIEQLMTLENLEKEWDFKFQRSLGLISNFYYYHFILRS